MEASKVYFADMRATFQENLPQKLRRLIQRAGIGEIDFDHKFVAVKLHFGEPGNLAYLRPQYARVLADYIREKGGRPFLTDCNTLYVGGRSNGLDHLDSALENGFSPLSAHCQTVIADGIKGTDEALIPIDGEYVREAKIGHALADADIIISLNHFKGHENTGFGGALKNLGMGGGSRAGKMEMHCDGKPQVVEKRCRTCRICGRSCAHGAISYDTGKARIDQDKCVGCGRCIGSCPFHAVAPGSDSSEELLNRKIAEYAYAVVKDKPHFHVSLAIDISPNCDCHSENDAPIVPDVGMFASFDPVAIDVACAEAVNAQSPFANSALGEAQCRCGDHFTNTHPNTDWRSQVEQGERIGLGSRAYQLVRI